MEDDTKLRLFTALELPDGWRAALAGARAELERAAPRDLKLVRPELMHLTLVFLGYQDPGALPVLQEALAAAAATVPPFSMALGRPGFFGQPHNLQVAWVGLERVPPELPRLHRALGEHLETAGVPFDRKPLVAHITLARGRRPMDRQASARAHGTLLRLRLPAGLTVNVREFVLMQSHLSRLGPEYQVMARFPLAGAAEPKATINEPGGGS